MGWPENCYRALLFCYPAEFRYEYGPEMTQAFRDRWHDEGSLLLWFNLIADVATTAPKEHFLMLLNDLLYAARTLRKAPVFTAAAALTLALGVGANTAIFTVVNAEILRPLPYEQPDRLVRVFEKNDKLNIQQFASSVLNYLSWKEQTKSLSALGSMGFATFNLTGTGDPEQFNGSPITPSLIPLLGIQPVRGRAFQEGEDRPGSPAVAMISEGLWKRRFGGDSALIGQTISLNGVASTVVGIAPRALTTLTNGDIWVPMTIDPNRENRLNHVIVTVARIAPGVSLEQARAEMDTVSQRVGMQYPEGKDWGVFLMPFPRWFVQDQLRTALLVLLGAVVLVLLIACANVANLLLSRAASRQNEIAVRTALGASRSRLLRQLLTESLLLSCIGGAAGLLLAAWAVHLMNAGLPQNLLPIDDLKLDSSVLWFTLAITIATGILFGLAPALQTAKSDLNTVMKQGGRSSVGSARPLLRNTLVAGELALATILLIGAGLLMQSLLRLQQVRLGFQTDRLLTFQLSLPQSKYPDKTKAWAFYQALLPNLRSVPGVRAAAVCSGIPLGAGNYNTTPATPMGKSLLPPGTAIPIDWRTISPGYFSAMEIPLVRGRYFTDQDGPDTPPVMLISQTAAQRLWGPEDPVGHIIRLGSNKNVTQFTVVGVVGDVRSTALSRDPSPTMYFPAANRMWPLMDIVVRTQMEPMSAISAVRQKIHELDSELPMSTIRTMDQWVTSNAVQPRLNSVLLAVFAMVALLIAAIGIFGVLTYSVNQRTREIGVRMALGAQRTNVLRLVVREGMLVALAGIGAGLAGAIALSRLLATLLFGVNARDFATFATVTAVLVIVALISCYLPARRATRVDPIIALRYE